MGVTCRVCHQVPVAEGQACAPCATAAVVAWAAEKNAVKHVYFALPGDKKRPGSATQEEGLDTKTPPGGGGGVLAEVGQASRRERSALP